MSLTTTNNSELATNLSHEDIILLRDTICKGCTEQDMKLFLMICNRTKLDPFAKQIYAVPRWDAKLNRMSMTAQCSIDGFRLVAERTGKYAPGRSPTYEYNIEGKLISGTAYVKKQTNDGTWHEVSNTSYFEEFVQKKKDGTPTQFWANMPRVMISKVAEATCLRKCFPMELSGIYTADEMEQATIVESEVIPQVNAEQERVAIELLKVQKDKLLGNFIPDHHGFVVQYLENWCKAINKSETQAYAHFLKDAGIKALNDKILAFEQSQKQKEE